MSSLYDLEELDSLERAYGRFSSLPVSVEREIAMTELFFKIDSIKNKLKQEVNEIALDIFRTYLRNGSYRAIYRNGGVYRLDGVCQGSGEINFLRNLKIKSEFVADTIVYDRTTSSIKTISRYQEELK